MTKVQRGTKIKKINKVRTKLARQGKLKLKRHKKRIEKLVVQPEAQIIDEEAGDEKETQDDMVDMVDISDVDFIKRAIISGSYSFLDRKNFIVQRKNKVVNKKENKKELEDVYEEKWLENNDGRRTRLLLPIKSKEGIIRRAITEHVTEESEGGAVLAKEEPGRESEGSDEFEVQVPDRDVSRPISVAEMLAWREQTLDQYKFRIGLLCSGLLEDPENKIMNVKKLLDIFDEWHPELQITLKKLVTVSLLEVFKDILPSYQIKHQDDEETKLKKDTRKLQNYEKSLLKGYRGYLTRLEKLASRLHKKMGDTRVVTKHIEELGEIAINCFGQLITAHPYFNYSNNIIQMLTPYLDNKRASVRATISRAYHTVFTSDKRGDVTFQIVRRVNDLVKRRKHLLKPDAILVLEYLNLSNINLEEIKEQQVKHKKALAKKKRLINLSKRERKRQKRLAEVEQELMETKGEENRKNREATLTEVTKIVFTIYFRILKSAPSSGLLSAALQGLAKFAACINIEFYLDLVTVLDKLMKAGELSVKERLNCCLTVFTILSGQGEVLNIDPNQFYQHLYTLLFHITAGENRLESRLVVECLEKVILVRRKKLTLSRLVGFIKRLAIMSLHQEHNTTLAALAIIKQIFQLQKATDVLLETDCGVGEGLYLPHLQDAEHCHAASSALYELSLLKRHYQPTVRLFADHLARGVPASGEGCLPSELAKLSVKEVFTNFDCSQMAFNPAVSTQPLHTNTKGSHPLQVVTNLTDKYLSEFCVSLMDLKPIKMEEG